MIYKEAVRSLKNDRSRAVFFALTFFVTTALLFFFFNMAETTGTKEAEVYVASNNLADLGRFLMEGNISNLMLIFVVVMCSVDLFFCNDFFVKHKAKEVGVRMICGATYFQMTAYILIQTVLLMAVSIPFGILAGYGLLRLMNVILAAQNTGLAAGIDAFAMVEFISVMIMIVFWTTALNCGFTYRSGAVLLTGGDIQAMQKDTSGYGIFSARFFRILLNIAGIILALLPFYSFFKGSSGLAVSAAIGCVGLNRVISEIFLPALAYRNRKKGTSDTVRAVAGGFLRRDIHFSKTAVFLLITDLLVMTAMLFSRKNTAAEQLLIIVTYICISVLQSLTVMFRLETDLSGRTKEYRILSQIGVDENQESRIAGREITLFYLFVLGILILYPGCAVLSLLLTAHADPALLLLLCAAALIPLAAVYLLSMGFYRKILKEKQTV